jgi:hypothetical protein
LHDNLYNSYGAYPLYEAVTELINHQVYDVVLPVKTVPYLAIIGIGVSDFFVTAEQSGEIQKGKTQLAIGVRMKAVRIGHFLPSKFYKPHPDYINQIIPDIERVKIANSNLYVQMENESGVTEMASEFLLNNAKQLAFCHINRIAHGALTPSNMTLDGKWIDLTNTTFIPPGYKHITASGTLHSENEKETALDVFCMFLSNFIDQAGYGVELQPIRDFYFKRLNHYMGKFLIELLGLDTAQTKINLNKDVIILLKTYNEIIESQSSSLKGVPVSQKVEGVLIDFIKNLFKSLNYKDAIYPFNSSESATKAFQRLFFTQYRTINISEVSINSFTVLTVIKSLRKVYFPAYFYVGRIYLLSREVVKTFDNGKINKLINDFSNAAKWIFGKLDNDENVQLLKITHISLNYLPKLHKFSLKSNQKELICSNIVELRKLLSGISSDKLEENDFDFLPSLLEILGVVESVFIPEPLK